MPDDQRPQARCTGCGKTPDQLLEYSPQFTNEDTLPEDYVWREEGTLNPYNGHFLCTGCYIAAGMPSAEGGWVAP